jgi:hypothetical protein
MEFRFCVSIMNCLLFLDTLGQWARVDIYSCLFRMLTITIKNQLVVQKRESGYCSPGQCLLTCLASSQNREGYHQCGTGRNIHASNEYIIK